jgi:ABC-2 type transport system permease protein
VTLLSGTELPFGEAVLRLLGVCAYIAVSLAGLGALGLFVSTLTEQPIGATVAILIVNVLSFILDSIPQVSWLHPYLFTHYWLNFGDLLRDPVPLDGLGQGLLATGIYALVFWTAAWARFSARDVTS